MPKVTFVHPDSRRQTVEIAAGRTIMEAAVNNNVSGIEADCGGSCACATCHVYIEPDFLSKLNAPSEGEAAMLEFAVNPRENSRLSCCITVNYDVDGITVNLPESQY
jgi:2Fe-2S ferredoxin